MINIVKVKGYRGENAVYKLIENLLEEQKEIKKNKFQ